MKRPTLIASVLFVAATSSTAQASIFCKRVGDDPYGMKQELVILEDKASLFFSMPDGEVRTIGLSCHVIEKEPHDAALCQRTSEDDDGRISVAQYLITEISPVATPMMITEFTYADPAKTDEPHYGTYEGFSVRCIQE